jgi:hypothetical protein
MDPRQSRSCTAFAGADLIAAGQPREVALVCRALLDADDDRIVIVFDDESAQPLEFDLRGGLEDVADRYVVDRPEATQESPRGPGRPKMGVVGKEVTLLPRHWEWLSEQPGGASVTLRKLVERARKESEAPDRVRRSQDVSFRFMSAICGNEPGYEEACRSLFACDCGAFEAITEAWPDDVRAYALRLAEDALAPHAASLEHDSS